MPIACRLLVLVLLSSGNAFPSQAAPSPVTAGNDAPPRVASETSDPPRVTLTLSISEDSLGTPTAARLSVKGETGVAFRPLPDSVGFFHTPMGGFFYADSIASLSVDSGLVHIRATKGPEFRDVDTWVAVQAETTIAVLLERWIDMDSLAWVSGDAHAHLRHAPIHYNLDVADGLLMARAEGLHLANFLEEDSLLFTGMVDTLSDSRVVGFVGQEYRSSYFGHLGLLGIDELLYPWGNAGWPLTAGTTLAVRAHNSALSVLSHPITTTTEFESLTTWPGNGLGRGLWVDAGLGALDGLDLISYSNEGGFALEPFERLWNAGFPVPASAGSDAGMCNKGSLPLGGSRVYVRVPNPHAPPKNLYDDWVDEQRRGRTFTTTGPLLTAFDVGGVDVGESLLVANGMPVDLLVTARIESAFPLTRADIVVNGEIVRSIGGGTTINVSTTIPIRETSWVTVRHIGPSQGTFSPMPLAILVPTPTLVVLEGDGLRSAPDGAYALEQIDRLDSLLVVHGDYPTPAESLALWEGLGAARAAWAARANAAPLPFHLLWPPQGQVLINLFPLLRWGGASDPDSADAVTYRLVLAADAAFDSIIADVSGLTDTTWTSGALSGIAGSYWWRVRASDTAGDKRWAEEIGRSFSVVVEPQVGVSPEPGAGSAPLDATGRLFAVSPNPAAHRVVMRLAAPALPGLALRIFDVTGREVRALDIPAGVTDVVWDARDASGRAVASGTYQIRFDSPRGSQTRTVTILH